MATEEPPKTDSDIADEVVFDAAQGKIKSIKELDERLEEAGHQISTDTGSVGVTELIERRHTEHDEYGPLIIGSMNPDIAKGLGLITHSA